MLTSYFKREFNKVAKALEHTGWNSLYWNNHDRLALYLVLVMMECIALNQQNVSDSSSYDERNAIYLSRRGNWNDERSIPIN